MGRNEKKAAANMMATHPSTNGTLYPVEELASSRGIKPGELAGLCRAKGWASGKQVSEAECEAAVEAFSNRPMGGGRI